MSGSILDRALSISIGASSEGSVSVGAFLPSCGETLEYAKRIDGYVQTLHYDIRYHLAYSDPALLETQARGFDVLPGGAPTASELRGDAVRVRTRLASISPTQGAGEMNYGRVWLDFLHRWNAFYASTESDISRPLTTFCGDVWDATIAYEAEFQKLRDRYKGMGVGSPSGPEPVTPAEIEKISSRGFFASIPWTPILVIAGLFVATKFLAEIRPEREKLAAPRESGKREIEAEAEAK